MIRLMRIETRSVNDVCADDELEAIFDVAVVIDVIRAFTVAPWVLRRGAQQLILAPDASSALDAQAAKWPGALLVKDRAPDSRFLPNAPGLISTLDLSGWQHVQDGSAAGLWDPTILADLK